MFKIIDPKDKDRLWKEASILGGLNHPNIIKFYCCGFHEVENQFELVMEYGKKTLSEHLSVAGPLEETNAVDIMLQIANGMCYLHDMKVAHRDLKPGNVVVSLPNDSTLKNLGCLEVKLLDFGISKVEVKDSPEVPTGRSKMGTRGYMAPEAMANQLSEVDALKADVFSFGMMCYEILSNKRAYTGKMLRDYVRFLENKRPELPKTCSKDLKSLIHECWSSEPLNRPTFLDIFERLRKVKSDAMLKVASDVRVAKILHESTTPSNFIEYPKRCWTMVKQKLHGLNIWPHLLLWQMFITFAQWLPRYISNFLKAISISSSSAQENSNITTSNKIGHEVSIE